MTTILKLGFAFAGTGIMGAAISNAIKAAQHGYHDLAFYAGMAATIGAFFWGVAGTLSTHKKGPDRIPH